jgi:hypothetical protein
MNRVLFERVLQDQDIEIFYKDDFLNSIKIIEKENSLEKLGHYQTDNLIRIIVGLYMKSITIIDDSNSANAIITTISSTDVHNNFTQWMNNYIFNEKIKSYITIIRFAKIFGEKVKQKRCSQGNVWLNIKLNNYEKNDNPLIFFIVNVNQYYSIFDSIDKSELLTLIKNESHSDYVFNYQSSLFVKKDNIFEQHQKYGIYDVRHPYRLIIRGNIEEENLNKINSIKIIYNYNIELVLSSIPYDILRTFLITNLKTNDTIVYDVSSLMQISRNEYIKSFNCIIDGNCENCTFELIEENIICSGKLRHDILLNNLEYINQYVHVFKKIEWLDNTMSSKIKLEYCVDEIELWKGFYIISDYLDNLQMVTISVNGNESISFDKGILYGICNRLFTNTLYIPFNNSACKNSITRESFIGSLLMSKCDSIFFTLFFDVPINNVIIYGNAVQVLRTDKNGYTFIKMKDTSLYK